MPLPRRVFYLEENAYKREQSEENYDDCFQAYTLSITLNKGVRMLKKSLGVVVVLLTGGLGMMLSCNSDNPVSPQTDVNGTWTGLTAIRNSGAGQPDTFTCVLKIGNSATTYSMLRGRVVYGSSGSTSDSAKESGTVTKIGTDSLVLTPSGTTCYYWDPGLATWLLCDGTLNAQFRTCPDPMHIKIDISGTSWNASILRFDDLTSVTYSLKKQ